MEAFLEYPNGEKSIILIDKCTNSEEEYVTEVTKTVDRWLYNLKRINDDTFQILFTNLGLSIFNLYKLEDYFHAELSLSEESPHKCQKLFLRGLINDDVATRYDKIKRNVGVFEQFKLGKKPYSTFKRLLLNAGFGPAIYHDTDSIFKGAVLIDSPSLSTKCRIRGL